MSNDLFNIDNLLNDAMRKQGLKELFQNKIDELKLNKTNVQEILEIPYRTLNGVLDGTQKLVDITNLIKIADFIQIPKEQVFKLYVESLQKHHQTSSTPPQKIKFIKENFELSVLKKAGLINSVTNFEHIEQRITSRLGFKSIYEYKKPNLDVAFSSGLFKPKNILTRLFWIKSAICTLEEIDNENVYDKKELIKVLPQIPWHTMDEEKGLAEVIKILFKIGITVIYQPNLQGLQLRGATLNINDNPCIVLTNYQGFYSTLWFCLLHELYHVLFDWEDIKNDSYHLTDDDNEELTVREREEEADKFASEYLFSKENMDLVKSHISNEFFVKKIANENHIHHSIVYAIYAYQTRQDRKSWARAKRTSPAVSDAIKYVDFPWDNDLTLQEYVTNKKQSIYN